MDFDPFEFHEKFPVSFSLESIATVIVPMGKYPLSNWRSECSSIIDSHTSSTDQVNKPSCSGSYLNICEDCKCKSSNKEVCDCDLRSFQSGADSIARISAWNRDSEEDSDMEGPSAHHDESTERDSVVTVAPGEIRTDDSGIECGFTY